jgi:hypothetical protein
MPWFFYIAHLIAGLILANSIPHFINGISGRSFISPFGDPPGRGHSSAVSNVLWGALNMVVGFAILWWMPIAVPLEILDVVVFAFGFFFAAIVLGNAFSQRHAETKT